MFVWLHGGSLWVCQSGDYDPSRLVREGKAIVVTLNYRLGMFGFFAHPAITAEEHPSASYGQMDQSFALDWVQRNIAAFGGDPLDVTIAGESSGGNSVVAQVVSPWSAGKFQQAIGMSGASVMLRHPSFGAPRPLDEAEAVGADFAEATGCAEADEVTSCLRALTPGQILAPQTPYLINQTIIDGDFMPEHPAEALREERFNRVTLVNGITRDAGRFFVALPEKATGQSVTEDTYPAALVGFFGESLGAEVEAESSPRDYHSPSEALAAAITDYLFACPGARLNELASEWADLYAYEFADRTAPSYLEPTTFPLGTAHTYELSDLFSGFHGGKLGHETTLNPLQQELTREMVRYWTSAAEAADWQAWSEYDAKQGRMLRLRLPGPRVIDRERFATKHWCGFWDQTGVY